MERTLVRAGYAILLSLAITAVCPAARAQRVEKLIKNGKEFYGWQVSKTDFKTCDDTPISIENGRVTVTERQCPERPPLEGLAYTGQIVSLKMATAGGGNVGDLKVKTASGVERDFFVPAAVFARIQPKVRDSKEVWVVKTIFETRVESVEKTTYRDPEKLEKEKPN